MPTPRKWIDVLGRLPRRACFDTASAGIWAAISAAAKSSHHSTLVGAALVVGHKVVRAVSNVGTLHAEARALRNRPRIAYRNATLVVARVWKTGQVVDSVPCDACMLLAKNCGIKTVIASRGGVFGRIA